MKKLYTNEARQSEIDRITHLIEVVSTARGDVIPYLDAIAIGEILADRRRDIEAEIRDEVL